MVSPASDDAPEGLRKTAGTLELQASAEQEVLPADQAQVLNKVGRTLSPSLWKEQFVAPDLDASGWVGTRKHWGSSLLTMWRTDIRIYVSPSGPLTELATLQKSKCWSECSHGV